MYSKCIQSILSFSLMTSFALPSMAQPGVHLSHFETEAKVEKLPLEVKHLPLILDAANLNIQKFRDARIENLDLKKLYGPGSSGGGNLCAYNITTATDFILRNIKQIPFENHKQEQDFVRKISSVLFMSGENLKVREQSVNARNYPEYGVIVLDGKACDSLSDETIVGNLLLLHEYLGIAGIDDTTYQVSDKFAKAVKTKLSFEKPCNTDGCVFNKISQGKAVMDWIAKNDDCENAVSWMQSLRKISNSKFEVICGDTSDRHILILNTQPVPGQFVVVP